MGEQVDAPMTMKDAAIPLTDAACKNTKPRDNGKPFKLSDERGMHLEIMPNGAKYWRLKYRFNGKEKRLAIGVYCGPTQFDDKGNAKADKVVTKLGETREKRDEARRLLAEGIDPGEHRKVQKAAKVLQAENSFEAVTREWFAKYQPTWVASHADKIMRRFERDLFPWLGSRPIADIEAPELLAALRRIEKRGAMETAHRAMQNTGQVFRYAIATGRAKRNPAADLTGALAPTVKKSFPTITDPAKVAELLRAIDGHQGTAPA